MPGIPSLFSLDQNTTDNSSLNQNINAINPADMSGISNPSDNALPTLGANFNNLDNTATPGLNMSVNNIQPNIASQPFSINNSLDSLVEQSSNDTTNLDSSTDIGLNNVTGSDSAVNTEISKNINLDDILAKKVEPAAVKPVAANITEVSTNIPKPIEDITNASVEQAAKKVEPAVIEPIVSDDAVVGAKVDEKKNPETVASTTEQVVEKVESKQPEVEVKAEKTQVKVIEKEESTIKTEKKPKKASKIVELEEEYAPGNMASTQPVSSEFSLGIEDDSVRTLGEIDLLDSKLATSKAPDALKNNAEQLIDRLKRMVRLGTYSREFDMISTYIDWITKYPWETRSEEVLDIKKVKEELDKNHYGLDLVKERIYQYMAVRILLTRKKDFEAIKRSPVLCMVGLQGIGKTTMAKSMARALNRPFYRISLGAIGSTLEIRGRNKSIEGAEPGQIVKAIVSSGVVNPLILLDELDKASGQTGLLADIMATMLEILDPEQNNTFRDHYMDYPIDLSEVMFVVSANKIGTFSAALLDRLEVIRMPSYTDDEKKVIAKNFLLPRVRLSTGLDETQITFDESLWPVLLRPLGFDSGIRSLQRMIDSMVSKAALEIVEGKSDKVVITDKNFKDYLPKY